jgi:hypothetical protein
MTIKVRAVIHFFHRLDMPDEDILARLENAYGEGIANLKTVQHWTLKFRNGKTDIGDEPRPWRLRWNENCRE